LGSNGVLGDAPRLVYTDTDNTTIQRQYRINTSTANGSILLNGKALSVGSVFTQNDLDNNRVTYKHDGSENYTDGFTFEVRDGSAAPVPGTYGISITPKNDPPTLVVPATQTFSTTTPLTFNTANGNRIVIDDPDLLVVENGETDIIQVTLDFQATGATYTGSTLTLGSTTGLTITQGTSGTAGGKITVKGTKAAVQAALDELQVQVPADEDRVLSLVVTVDDLLNGDPVIAATGEVVTKTINLNTSNINDAPTIANPASISVNEDTSFSFTGANAISIIDVDTFASANNTVTVSVTQGKLTLASTDLITDGANNSGTLTLTGTLAAINTALAGLSYQGNANVNGSDTLSISFNDQGNIGTGGAQIANQTVGITLVPVNDAPNLVAPSGIQTIATTGVLTFNAANSNTISIDDIIDLNPTRHQKRCFRRHISCRYWIRCNNYWRQWWHHHHYWNKGTGQRSPQWTDL
jgi:large repetitive protein